MPNLCVSSPYIADHLGGGEKYLLDIATQAKALGWKVTVALPKQLSDQQLEKIQQRLETFYGQSLTELKWLSAPWIMSGSVFTKWHQTAHFDAFFWITDGSLFISGAKQNILHFQVPFMQPASMLTKLKLLNWPKRTANSEFTRQHIVKSWGVDNLLTHPPLVRPIVSDSELKQLKKEKTILSVGRFFKQLHSKRQDVLVSAFADLVAKQPKLAKGWKLVLVGAVEDEAYFAEVKKLAKNLPVEFKTDLDRNQLEHQFRSASIYWHAAGYQVDEQVHPEKVEHFGISTVEAMSAGCIPLVVAKGGQASVIGDTFLPLSWNTIEELVAKTVQVWSTSDSQQADWRRAAYTQSTTFGEAAFQQILTRLL